jgi:rhamnosyltransferase
VAGDGATDVGVIVLCQNEASTLRATLEAILAQALTGSFDVTVVDCESSDGSAAIARSLSTRVIEIRADSFHHARTRNLAAAKISAPVLVYTNGHAMPVNRYWLERLTAPLRRAPYADLAGVYGRQLPCDDANPMEEFTVGWFFGPTPRLQRAVPGEPLWREQTLFSTVNCAIRRDLWLQRPFSDAVSVSEDQEWSRYWLARGYAVAYEPEAAVIHSHNESIRKAFRRAYNAGLASERSYLPRRRSAVTRFTWSNLRRLWDEALFLIRRGHATWLPYAAVYECLRIIGWGLGRELRGTTRGLQRSNHSPNAPPTGDAFEQQDRPR